MRGRVGVAIAALIGMTGTTAVHAQAGATSAADDAAAFGTRESVQQISLSPDGTHYAAVMATKGTGNALIVGPVDGTVKPTIILTSTGKPEKLSWCRWANDARLVCGMATTFGKGVQAIGFTRLLGVNAAGGGMKLLSAAPADNAIQYMQDGGSVIDWYGDPDGGSVLMTRQFVETNSTGSNIASQSPGLGVERVDPVTARRATIIRPHGEAEEYISDGHGTVRIMGERPKDVAGYLKNNVRYSYRKPDDKDWLPLSTVTGGDGFEPYAVDPKLNVAYGFQTLDGRQALYQMALDGSGKKELVFARPDVDINDVIKIGRQRRVVGVSYVTDKRQTAFFDPELKRLQAGLSKAVPNLPLVSFVDASADESRILLW